MKLKKDENQKIRVRKIVKKTEKNIVIEEKTNFNNKIEQKQSIYTLKENVKFNLTKVYNLCVHYYSIFNIDVNDCNSIDGFPPIFYYDFKNYFGIDMEEIQKNAEIKEAKKKEKNNKGKPQCNNDDEKLEKKSGNNEKSKKYFKCTEVIQTEKRPKNEPIKKSEKKPDKYLDGISRKNMDAENAKLANTQVEIEGVNNEKDDEIVTEEFSSLAGISGIAQTYFHTEEVALLYLVKHRKTLKFDKNKNNILMISRKTPCEVCHMRILPYFAKKFGLRIIHKSLIDDEGNQKVRNMDYDFRRKKK